MRNSVIRAIVARHIAKVNLATVPRQVNRRLMSEIKTFYVLPSLMPRSSWIF